MRGHEMFVELSHPIEDGLITHPGLPAPSISDFLSREQSRERYEEGTSFQIARVEMVVNTGTYVDAPFHRFVNGRDIASLSLQSLADLDGVVIRATERSSRVVDPSFFREADIRDKAVLIHTGWSEHWGEPAYAEAHPFLTAETATLLAEGGATLVGIDTLNVDDLADGGRPAHTIFLQRGIPIVEHMCGLEMLPDSGFRFFAVPAPFRNVGSFPVRAFAIVG